MEQKVKEENIDTNSGSAKIYFSKSVIYEQNTNFVYFVFFFLISFYLYKNKQKKNPHDKQTVYLNNLARKKIFR